MSNQYLLWGCLVGLVSGIGCASSVGTREFPTSDGQTTAGAGGTFGLGAAGSAAVPSSAAGNTGFIAVPLDATVGGGDQTGPRIGPYVLPIGYTAGKKRGFKLGELLGATPPPDAVDGGDIGGCGGKIRAVIRDFKRGDKPGGHPDFEKFMGSGEKGIVKSKLAADFKPAYVDSPHQFTTAKANFDQWYRTVSGINQAYLLDLVVQPNGGVYTFESDAFFPLDGQGFGNEGFEHNFSFSTEVHTGFKYEGGETFSFSGDDDVWVFINGRIAIDLGGVHQAQAAQVSLDQQAAILGIMKGQVYSLDLFQAERHSVASNFRIDTNLGFVDCGIVVDVR